MDIFEKFGFNKDISREDADVYYRRLKKHLQEESYNNGAKGEEAAEKLQKLEADYSNLKRAFDERDAKQKYGDNFGRIEDYIKNNDLKTAQKLLDESAERSAEWHYLQSIVYYKQNWFLESKKQLEFAMSMDSGNLKYKESYEKLVQILASNTIDPDKLRSSGRPASTPNMRAGNGTCTGSCCTDLCLADCCCECMGGDLIACC